MSDQCRAVTGDGERCSRPAEEDGFCHQHGPEDDTVDDADSTEATDDENDAESAQTEANDTQTETNDTQNGSDDREESRRTDDDAEENGSDADERGSDSDRVDIVTVRNTVQRDVPNLISRDLDGVTSLVREGDGWVATVELVERHSVPDTQDILGHYEISLSEQADIVGYRRLETYRRADGPPYEG